MEVIQRVIWIDYSKFALIVFMVWGHATNPSDWVHSFIYAFHIPAFFVVSGFLHKNKSLKDTILSLLIPTLLFSLVWYPHYVFSLVKADAGISLYDLFIKPLAGFWFYDGIIGRPMCRPFWFVVVLLLMKLFYLWVRPTSLNVIIVILCLVFSYSLNGKCNFTYFFLLQKCVIAYPFFLFGIYLRKVNIMTIIGNAKLLYKGLICIFGFSIVAISISFNGFVDLYFLSLGNSVITYFFISIIGSVSLFVCCSIFTNLPSHITNIARGTLVILGLHGFILLKILGHVPIKDSFILTVLTIAILYFPLLYILKHFPVAVGRLSNK